MATFGIIGEGITDQIVIESILIGYFGDQDEEPIVTYVQPLLDQTGQKSAPEPGGWGLVLKFLAQGEHERALQWNEYLIVHIDTDVSEQKGYDVPRRVDGRELIPEELVSSVASKLKSLIGEELYQRHGDRFIFAIAVHGIECWLLPLFFDNNKAAKTTGCLAAVDHELKKRNKSPLTRGESKIPQNYREASSAYTDRKKLLRLHDKNPSLRIFVEQLRALSGVTTPEESASPKGSSGKPEP